MQTTLTNNQFLGLYTVCNDLFVTAKKNKDFKMHKILNVAIDSILAEKKEKFKSLRDSVNERPEKMSEYEDKVRTIFTQYKEKDEKFEENENLTKDFEAEIEKLNEEYKETIEEAKKIETEINELLKEEIEMDLPKIKFKYFPEELNNTQMRYLKIIRRETDEEILKSLENEES